MLFLLVACASLVAGVAGVARASRMPKLVPTAPASVVPAPSAIARVYGRRVPTAVRELALADTIQLSRPGSPATAG